VTQPASVPTDGNLKVVWVPTIADPANPTMTELTAASAVDLSCYLTSDGFTPSTDEAVVTDDRLCSVQTFEQPGRITDKLDIKYVYQPQNPDATDNKAFATLRRLAAGFIVSRWGKSFLDAFAAGDIVDVMPAKAGKQVKQAPEANSQFKVGQKIFIVGEVQEDVAVVA
jgi:hypothetical protein